MSWLGRFWNLENEGFQAKAGAEAHFSLEARAPRGHEPDATDKSYPWRGVAKLC